MSRRVESNHGKWARFRFSVVGPLLAAPPARGELRPELERLAAKTWRHPISGESVTFALSTIERWYYQARAAGDPVGALRRRVRKDAGQQRALKESLRAALRKQHSKHRGWSHQLHYDNLKALAEADKDLGRVPSYSTVLRYMKAAGLQRDRRRRKRGETAGQIEAAERFERREVRSYEVEYVGGLWHLDFHEGSRPVLTRRGEWVKPWLFGCLDDRSRLACHLQWYYVESAETLVHGLVQALLKRGLPGALMTDRGGAERAGEVEAGLAAWSIVHKETLAESPYQNGKQESFWGLVEGRLLPMLEGVDELTLDLLNEVTQPWVELDYNRAKHSELPGTPLERWLAGPDVLRPSPDPVALRDAFRVTERRSQRRGDGTVSVEGQRFEVPSTYRHLERVAVRYARWDLSRVHLVDPRSERALSRLYPQDKARNASGQRRSREPLLEGPLPEERPQGMAPLLAKYVADYAASGLPAPFLAHSDPRDSDGDHAVADRDDGDHDHEEDDVQDDEESV